jgi:hypothetical protein
MHFLKQKQKTRISVDLEIQIIYGGDFYQWVYELTDKESMELSATIVPWETVPSDSSVKHDTSSGSMLKGWTHSHFLKHLVMISSGKAPCRDLFFPSTSP